MINLTKRNADTQLSGGSSQSHTEDKGKFFSNFETTFKAQILQTTVNVTLQSSLFVTLETHVDLPPPFNLHVAMNSCKLLLSVVCRPVSASDRLACGSLRTGESCRFLKQRLGLAEVRLLEECLSIWAIWPQCLLRGRGSHSCWCYSNKWGEKNCKVIHSLSRYPFHQDLVL